jgi:hypothetical protein
MGKVAAKAKAKSDCCATQANAAACAGDKAACADMAKAKGADCADAAKCDGAPKKTGVKLLGQGSKPVPAANVIGKKSAACDGQSCEGKNPADCCTSGAKKAAKTPAKGDCCGSKKVATPVVKG